MTTSVGDGARFGPNLAAQQGKLGRIGDLSRIVDDDIKVLKTNLAQFRYLHEGDEDWQSAWARLESAWETVRSGLADDEASTQLTEVLPPANGTTGAIPQSAAPAATLPMAKVGGEPLSWAWATQAARWTREYASKILTKLLDAWNRAREPDGELRQALRRFSDNLTISVNKFASASARQLARTRVWALASCRNLARVSKDAQVRLESAFGTLKRKLAEHRASTSLTEVVPPFSMVLPVDSPAEISPTTQVDLPADSLAEMTPTTQVIDQNVRRTSERGTEVLRTNPSGYLNGQEGDTAWGVQGRVESAKEAVKSKLADGKTSIVLTGVAGSVGRAVGPKIQGEAPIPISPTGPFVLKPLPWVLGALSPVISSRTMQIHHGCHHAQCIELANRLSRSHDELAGMSPLEVVRWAREHARGTELHAAASDALNHAFFFQSLTPWKKRPGGELRGALERSFGDFASFADKFASAGATHLGSGWLWLVANRRKQVRIMTTSDMDCPEARGHTCLLAIDLWEHAYYFDHQNRRREYLDAVIDRRLDWEFAEHRFRLLLERDTCASREVLPRPDIRRRVRHHKRRRKAAASRR
jgi:superoxide dismutase, Fe-Mn family